MTTAADVLGVDESATDEEIQAAFREQARRFHPDRFDPDALDIDGIDDVDPDELFRDVKQARDALTGADSGALSLQHEWKNGDPQCDEPWEGSSEQTASSDGSNDATRSQTDDSSGTDSGYEAGESTSSGASDDGPWSSEGGTDDAGIDETIGVTIEDGPEESVSTSGGQTEPVVSRRNLLAAVGVGGAGLVAANWLGFFNSGSGTSSDSGRTTEHAVVGSSETIQDVADTVVPGGTLEIPSGTYSQYLSVDVDMSIVAPDGATLLGDGADVTAITVSDVDAEIEGLTIGNYDDGGIRGGGRDSDISISNVTIEDIGTTGLDLTGEHIDLDDVTSRSNSGTGVHLTSTDSGGVSVTNVEASGNDNPSLSYAASGLVVTGGEEIVIQESEATENESDNMLVEAGDASGQNVTVENTFVAGSNSGGGVRIAGSYGDDAVTVRETESVDNTYTGVDIGGENAIESTNIDGVTVRDNNSTGVRLMSTDSGAVTVSNAVVTGNNNPSFSYGASGIAVTGGEEVIVQDSEATKNESANVVVEPGDVRGQSVTITNTLAAGSSGSDGIHIEGSYGEDSLTIEDVQAKDNANYGFDLGGESVQIVDSDASSNEDGDLNLRDIDRDEADIQNSL